MTLATTTSRVSYPGAGSPGPFAFPFRIKADADLLVTRRSSAGAETVLALTTHYTVSGTGAASGAITLVSALAVGETLFIRRKPALTQPTSIRNLGEYFASTHEDEFDLLVMQLQALSDSIDRSIKLKESVNGGASLTELEPTAGKVVTGTGTGFTMSALDSSAVALPGQGRTTTTLSAYLANNSVFNLLDYANGVIINTDTNDAIAALNAATAAATVVGGGIIIAPFGVYKTTSKYVGARNVVLQGYNASGVAPGQTYNGETVIHGVHADVAIVDLRGVQAASLRDIKLYGDQVTTPKTGLLLGRTSAASAGFHWFSNLSVEGYFSVAPIYSIASEENTYWRPHVSLLGGGAKRCFYTSQGDDLGVGGLTGSSNIQGTMYSPWMMNAVNDATCSVIHIQGGASTFAWSFYGGYLIAKAGAYVTIDAGTVDASDVPGPITFSGVSGEKLAGGLNPISGFNLTAPANFSLRSLVVLGCKFELDAAGFFIRQGANVRIRDSLIIANNTMGVGSSLIAAQIFNSRIDTGNATTALQYGDFELPAGTIFLPSDTAKGIQFGTAARMRHASGPAEVQLVDAAGANFYDFAVKEIHLQGSIRILSGAGSPETAVTAPVGSIYLRTDSATTLYVKQTGVGNTGWIAK